MKPVTNPDVEVEPVELTIDGEVVHAKPGISLYDVISKQGKRIAAMCYHYTFDPFGSCGVCLVTVEGKKAPVRSCTAKVQADMVVTTETPDLFEARKKAVSKHLSTHPLDCPVCDADGRCELQDMAFGHEITNLIDVKRKVIPEDTRSLVLDFNMERCIVCGECINICEDVQMINPAKNEKGKFKTGALQFLKKNGAQQVVAKGDVPLHCEFCGDCLAVCPVGAITNKFAKYIYKPWQLKTTTTTCTYCADGCETFLDTKDEKVVRVRSALSWKNKWGDRETTAQGHGGICVRGRFGFHYVDHTARLKQPLVRHSSQKADIHAPTPWINAIDETVRKLADIKSKHGGQAIAGLITARCTNEDLYVFQRLMRGALGTNNIDSSARYGHMNFVRAMRDATGLSCSMNSFEEITKAKAILLIGSDITETHPITGLRVKEAIRVYKSNVFIANPRTTHLAKLEFDNVHHLRLHPETENWFVTGLIKALIERDLFDKDATAPYPEALKAIKAALETMSLEAIAVKTNIDVDTIVDVATILTQSPRTVILCAEGVSMRAGGYTAMLNLIDLAWLTGALLKPGSGITCLPEEANEQGAVDMGVAPELLPGQVAFSDAEARTRCGVAWGCELPPENSGASLMEILDRCRNGQIKALYIVGENPLATLPASSKVREALENVEFLICQDLFMTETAKLAHVVFPACSYAEKVGSMTNFWGRIGPLNEALQPKEDSRPDWEVFAVIAHGLGHTMEYEGPQDVLHDIERLIPSYFSKERKEKPAPNLSSYLRNGYAANVSARYANPQGTPTGKSPILTLGQIIYHSGKLSTRSSALLTMYPNHGSLHLSQNDIESLGLGEADSVKISSPTGCVEMSFRVDDSLPTGLTFFPEHFSNPSLKDLIACTTDAVTGVPAFKSGPVTLEKHGLPSTAHAPKGDTTKPEIPEK
tara:strand:+ start:1558 stop:4362 length:2805 start_codon:yes stop_codon:yes gene_type:complete